MTYILFLIGIVCSNPAYYEKFNSEGSNEGIQRIRCENALQDCYGFSGDIKKCIVELKGM